MATADDESIEDDRLRLIFTCCHPALPAEARLALTLREVCGLTTEEIARAFLTAVPTVAQRIVRAKAKIKSARIPYQVPSQSELPDRLDTALHAIYLVFNEGYSASTGSSLTRPDLSNEAIRLARLLLDLLPETEVMGLLALLLLQESRRTARTSPTGELILLENQDRSLWNQDQIAEGSCARPTRARVGPDRILHASGGDRGGARRRPHGRRHRLGPDRRLYDLLLAASPSPVVELNRAVAVAMRDGPLAGLNLIDAILGRGDLLDYHLIHAARADMCRRLGRTVEARAAYRQALDRAQA